jgi:hypothetical protein
MYHFCSMRLGFVVSRYLLGTLGGSHYFLWRMLSWYEPGTARTARFSKKSPWSVFFRGEMSVICHKITVKCQWNHGENFTAKIYKLGPKCRWNILIVGDNTATKIIRVYTYMYLHFMCFFVCLVLFFLLLYISISVS